MRRQWFCPGDVHLERRSCYCYYRNDNVLERLHQCEAVSRVTARATERETLHNLLTNQMREVSGAVVDAMFIHFEFISYTMGFFWLISHIHQNLSVSFLTQII